LGDPRSDAEAQTTPSLRGLRASIIAMIVVLTAQGWTGDFSNLFASFSEGLTSPSMAGLLRAIEDSGVLVLYHALEAVALLVISIIVVALCFRSAAPKWAKAFAILGLVATVSASLGGVLFVLSSFESNANSAQMGGSFIGAYAFYFLTLYSTKK
jgi:hypothetical protein